MMLRSGSVMRICCSRRRWSGCWCRLEKRGYAIRWVHLGCPLFFARRYDSYALLGLKKNISSSSHAEFSQSGSPRLVRSALLVLSAPLEL